MSHTRTRMHTRRRSHRIMRREHASSMAQHGAEPAAAGARTVQHAHSPTATQLPALTSRKQIYMTDFLKGNYAESEH